MDVGIPEIPADLFSERAFAHLATMMPDHTPQLSPVWVDFDGKYIIIGGVEGEQIDRNMRMNPHVALEIQDPKDSDRLLIIRGVVMEISRGEPDNPANLPAKQFPNQSYVFRVPNIPRVHYKIKPVHVSTYRSLTR